MTRLPRVAVLAASLSLLLSALPALALPPPLYRLTAVPGAATFETFSQRLSLTDDGRGVCFDGRSYGYWTGDMFLQDSVAAWKYDFATNLLGILTPSAAGQYPDGRCPDPVISGDGKVVVFKNGSANLTPGPLPDGLYAHDLIKGGYDRCDVSSDGLTTAVDTGQYACVNRDGRYVVFATRTRLAANDTNDVADLYLRDRLTRTTSLQSVSTAGVQGAGGADDMECGVSADGKSIVFTSEATGLVPDASWPASRVYVRRVGGGGSTVCVSRNQAGLPVAGYRPSISADGRVVAYCSPVSGIAWEPTGGKWHVYTVNTVTGKLRWPSAPSPTSSAAAGDSNTGWGSPALSHDGRYVVFHSNDYRIFSKTAVANPKWQAVLVDLVDGERVAVSSVGGGVYGNDDSGPVAISAGGDRVAFFSKASNLVSGDGNGAQDVFARRNDFAIYGMVQTPTDAPLRNASIVAIERDSKSEYWTYSRSDGQYCLSGLRPATYDLWAYKAGYRFQPASHTLTLNAVTPALNFVGRPATGDGTVTYRALLVGIANYGDPAFDLKYCAQDARDMRSALLTAANWRASNIRMLLDKAATYAGAKQAVADLMASCDADDVCLIWWASHGTKDTDDYPYDETDGADEALLAVDLRPIVDDVFGHWLNRCGTSRYVLGLDCCNSGGHVVNKRPSDAGQNGEEWLAGFLADFRGTDPQTKDLNDNQCGAVLAAATDSETAQEADEFGNGVFSHFVLEGIGNRQADRSGDKWLSPAELMAYAKQPTIDVNRRLGYVQTPVQFAQGGLLGLPVIGAKTTPDLAINASGVGNDIFSSDGTHQSSARTVEAGSVVNWRLVVENDSAVARRIRVRGRAGSKQFAIKYRDADDGLADVTAAVTGEGWVTPPLEPGAARRLVVRVKTPPVAGARLGWQTITGAYAGDADRSDTVAVSVETVASETLLSPRISALTASPTSRGAEVRFILQSAASVRVRILNLAGREVRRLCSDRPLAAGLTRLAWDGRSDRGTLVPGGVYFVEVRASGHGGEVARVLGTLRKS